MNLTKLRRLGLLAATVGSLGLALAVPAQAQQSGGLPPPVATVPYPASSVGGNASSTIGGTGTFQKVFSATSGTGAFRKGCTIQNNGTHSMYVTEGLGVAASTESNSVVLAAGGIYYCQVGGIVLDGEIDITGTATDAFYAAQY